MPETEAGTAKDIIDRLSDTWLSKPLVEPSHQKEIVLTFSTGIAQFGPVYKNSSELIQAADRAMYAAKEAGRNRAFTIDQLDSPPAIQTSLILVADDSKVVRHVLEKQLVELGYSVISTGDGQKALEIAVSQHPKVALVDMTTPGMGSLELTRMIKENPKTMGIKVIALTSVSSKDTILNAFQLGADDYMNKPFSAQELEVRIKRLLNAKR